MIYDAKRQEFFVTVDDVTNNTEFTTSDLKDKLGDYYKEIIERDLSRMVNRVLYGLYKGTQPLRHRKYINAYVLTNSFAQSKLRDAFVELVKGAMYSGMDLNAYKADFMQGMDGQISHRSLPLSVMDELQMGQLLITGEKRGQDPFLDMPIVNVDLGV